jgi:ankyrin repeat protein
MPDEPAYTLGMPVAAVESEPPLALAAMTSFEDSLKKEELHFAAIAGDRDAVSALLASGANPNAFDDLGKTPLHYAAERAHLEVMKVLLQSGADVNAHDEARIGNTPLGEVAGSCSLEVARILVEAGADPTIPGWTQISALDLSRDRKRGDGPLVHSLLKEVADRRRGS